MSSEKAAGRGEGDALKRGAAPSAAGGREAARFYVLSSLGLALFWQFLRGTFLVQFFYAGSGTSATHLYFDVSLIVFAMTLAAFPALCGWLFDRRRPVVAALLAVGTCSLAVDAALDGRGASAALAATLSAPSFALLAVAWGRSCWRRMGESGYESVPTALALSFFLSFAVALPFTVAHVMEWLYVAVPVASGALWLAAEALSPNAPPGAPAEPGPNGVPASLRAAQRRAESRRLLASLCATSLFIVASGVLVGAAGDFDSITQGSGRQRFYETMAFALLLVGLTHLTVRRPEWRVITWGVALMLVLVGALLSLAFQDSITVSGANIITVGRRSVWFLVWFLVVSASWQDEEELTRNLLVFFAAMFGLSYVVIDLMRLSGGGAGDATLALTLVAAVLIVCAFAIIGSCLYESFTRAGYERALAELGGAEKAEEAADGGALAAMGPVGVPEGAARHRACASIAEERGLTEREQVTLEYLAMGYTMPHIAQTVGVSENTVRSHAKAIYRKLGCHSKQELIGMVEERMG